MVLQKVKGIGEGREELLEFAARCDCELGQNINPRILSISQIFSGGPMEEIKYDPVLNLKAIRKFNKLECDHVEGA